MKRKGIVIISFSFAGWSAEPEAEGVINKATITEPAQCRHVTFLIGSRYILPLFPSDMTPTS